MYFFENLLADAGADARDLGRILDSTWDSPMGTNWSSWD